MAAAPGLVGSRDIRPGGGAARHERAEARLSTRGAAPQDGARNMPADEAEPAGREEEMKRHLAYLSYVLRHKWFVMIECWRHGLIWRGLVHDLSKFRPSEWFPYARYFYAKDGSPEQRRDSTGYYKPHDTGNAAFDFAWLLHQKRNRHHWQWWILPTDEEGGKVLEMSTVYRTEMVCDWIGAGRAQGHGRDVTRWFRENRHKMRFHQITSWMVDYAVHHERGEE